MRNTSFDIYLAWSDRIVRVEADMSTLAALLAAGLAVESGCQTGGCGCCILPYVEGDLVHRDSCLSAGDSASREPPPAWCLRCSTIHSDRSSQRHRLLGHTRRRHGRGVARVAAPFSHWRDSAAVAFVAVWLRRLAAYGPLLMWPRADRERVHTPSE